MSEPQEHVDFEEDIFDVEEISNMVKYNIENTIGKDLIVEINWREKIP